MLPFNVPSVLRCIKILENEFWSTGAAVDWIYTTASSVRRDLMHNASVMSGTGRDVSRVT